MSLDLWFLRASQGYSGQGARPSGFEHHAVAKHGKAIGVRAEVSFKNYGHQHYEIEAKGGVVTPESTYRALLREITIESAFADGTWTGAVEGAEPSSFALAVGGDVDAMPSVVARWLPIWLPREEGELAAYYPLPEDGYPSWRPPGKGSYFPVLGIDPAERVIVGRGEEVLPRASAPAFRYDHVAEGEVVATTWIDSSGRPVAYEQTGCLLLIAREADARAVLRRALT